MEKTKFDELWDEIIKPYFRLFNTAGIYRLKWKAKERVYWAYQRQRNYLKKNYMQNPETHLDRHKVAACLLYAIVKVQPAKPDVYAVICSFLQKRPLTLEETLINEYIAFKSSLDIVNSFGERECEGEYSSIKLPNVKNGNSYIYNTCLDLYLSRKDGKLNIRTFANVFFLLEAGKFE